MPNPHPQTKRPRRSNRAIWAEILKEVREMAKQVRPGEHIPNPVLEERRKEREAFARFTARAARGNPKRGVKLLDELAKRGSKRGHKPKERQKPQAHLVRDSESVLVVRGGKKTSLADTRRAMRYFP